MNSKKTFSKRYIPIHAQIEVLKSRGVAFASLANAIQCLSTVSYYRLSGYFKPFQADPKDPTHKFMPGTSFEKIWGLYVFDRELRLCRTH